MSARVIKVTCQRLILTSVVLLLSVLTRHASAASSQPLQETPADASRVDSQESTGQNPSAVFQQEMEQLANRCQQLDREDLAIATRSWLEPQDPSRRYLYLHSPAYEDLLSVEPDDETANFWAKRVRQLREGYSQALLENAKSASAEKDLPSMLVAANLLQQAAYQNPENESVMRILGRKEKAGRWSETDFGRIGTARKSRRPERDLNWKPGSYLEAHSANFHLVTTANESRATEMLGRLETWRVLWKQFALPYWTSPEIFQSCLERERPLPQTRERKHEVVLFASRTEFLSSLSHISGIERSVGYYDGQLRRAFFYLDDQNTELEATWIHELAHQLFSEVGNRAAQPGEKSNTWLAEGIAIYFESLRPLSPLSDSPWQDFDSEQASSALGTRWSLGGFDADRLQDARIRWFREGYFVPFSQLTGRGRLAFQADAQIARTYSQSGAMCHFLMSPRYPEYQAATWELLTLLYSKRDRPDSLETLTQQSSATLEQQYKDWLGFDAEQVNWFALAKSADQLALGYSQLDSAGLSQLNAPNLFLLQLSSAKLDNQSADWFAQQHNLQQLFLDKNEIGDAVAVAAIKANPKLQDLDLAGTAVTDKTIAALEGNAILQQLWLTSTGITDASVDFLLTMPRLEKLDVRGCQLSPESLQLLSDHVADLRK